MAGCLAICLTRGVRYRLFMRHHGACLSNNYESGFAPRHTGYRSRKASTRGSSTSFT